MGVGNELLHMSHHFLDFLVGSVCRCVIGIHTLQFDVERRYITSVDAYNVGPDFFLLRLLNLFSHVI